MPCAAGGCHGVTQMNARGLGRWISLPRGAAVEAGTLAGGTPGVHATLPIQGAGHFVSEAALRTFVAPGAKVLIPMNGAYAQRMARLAREAGRIVAELKLPDTRGATVADIMPMLEADPAIGTVAMVFNETGSGIVNDADGIGRAGRRHTGLGAG